jgi:hypothetical protein
MFDLLPLLAMGAASAVRRFPNAGRGRTPPRRRSGRLLGPAVAPSCNNEGSNTMTEIAHFIDNVRVAGTSGRSQPVFNPATGATEKLMVFVALSLRR